MRILAPLAMVLAVFVIAACGGGDEAPTQPQASPFGTITVAEGTNRLEIDPPRRPPPRTLRIKDLRVGTGPVAHRGDRVAVYYKGVDYETGKRAADTWPPGRSLELRLGFTGWGDEWEEGIEGMRAGGRRELIVPFPEGRVTYYVVDLVRVRPGSDETAASAEGGSP